MKPLHSWQNISFFDSGTISIPAKTVADVMRDQIPTDDGWICPECIYHGGNLNCSKNVFISVVGANMSACSFFKRKCSCGGCHAR